MTEVPEEEEARFATEDTRGQDHLGGREARRHIPQLEEDQDPGPGPQLGGGRGPRGSGNTPSELFMENRKMAPQSEGEAMFDRFFRTGFGALSSLLPGRGQKYN